MKSWLSLSRRALLEREVGLQRGELRLETSPTRRSSVWICVVAPPICELSADALRCAPRSSPAAAPSFASTLAFCCPRPSPASAGAARSAHEGEQERARSPSKRVSPGRRPSLPCRRRYRPAGSGRRPAPDPRGLRRRALVGRRIRLRNDRGLRRSRLAGRRTAVGSFGSTIMVSCTGSRALRILSSASLERRVELRSELGLARVELRQPRAGVRLGIASPACAAAPSSSSAVRRSDSIRSEPLWMRRASAVARRARASVSHDERARSRASSTPASRRVGPPPAPPRGTRRGAAPRRRAG